jgi:agmatinase
VEHEHRASAERFLAAFGPDDPRAAAADVSIVGIPWDGAVTYRGGAKHAPPRIRAASDSIETWCPKLKMDLAAVPVVDHGDMALPEAGAGGEALVGAVRAALSQLPADRCLVIGGDHLVAYPPLERALARHPNLRIFHIDAHTDLRDSWEGERFNHATVLRCVLDVMPATARLYQWGIRSGLEEEFELQDSDPRIVPVENTGAAGLALAGELAAGDAPIYVTLDVDGLDPSQIPGTGTPEPGGLFFHDVEAALVRLAGGRAQVIGADLVEVAPPLDPSGITDVVAARLARTLLLVMRAAGRR